MKRGCLIFFLVVSICFCSFAVRNKSINGVHYQKEIQFKGSRGFWKPNSFLPQGRFVSQRLPQFQTIFTMRNSKRNGGNNRKAADTHPALATKQPLVKVDFPTQRIFDCLEKFYGRGGASSPTEKTNFLLTQFFSPEHRPASQWKKEFVADMVYEVSQLNDFIVQLYELHEWKKLYDEKQRSNG